MQNRIMQNAKAATGHFGKKGFTLFTALVAVMIIFLGVLITQAMIIGERGSTETIKDVEQESEMLDFANFARTDALHQFNFSLRFAFAKYFSKDDNPQDGVPENYFSLNRSAFSSADANEQWMDIQKDFIQQYFGDIGTASCNITESAALDTSVDISQCRAIQIVGFASDNIVSALQLREDPQGRAYFARIESVDPESFKRILLFVFSRSAKQNDFLKVADCDWDYTGGDCSGGGFYINLDFSPPSCTVPSGPGNPCPQANQRGISDRVYEALPQVQVTQSSSCDSGTGALNCFKTLKQPIFPRSSVRVFVPVRIFKAVAAAKQAITTNTGTIFDETGDLKKELKKIKLGVCDTKTVSLDVLDGPARSCQEFDLAGCYPRLSFESPETPRGFGKACIGHEGLAGINQFQPTMIGVGYGISYNPNEPDNVTMSASSAIEKYVKETKLPQMLASFSFAQTVASSGGPDFEMLRNGSSLVWGSEVSALDFPSRTVIFNGGQKGFSMCTKISQVGFNFVFQENDPKYIVELKGGTTGTFKPRFRVRVVDNEFAEYAEDGSDASETPLASPIAKCITTASYSCELLPTSVPTFGSC